MRPGSRSWFVVACLCISLGIAHGAPSVAVDLSRLESSDAAALEQALVMRLLQEGFAIDPLTAQPAIVVAITGRDHELVLSAKSAYFERSRTIDISESSGAQLQLELVQRVVELARLAREAAPPASPVTAEDSSVRQQTGERMPGIPRWQVGGDLGVLSNGTLETSLHARFAIAPPFGVLVRADLAKPDAREASVDEQELLAGASYERPLSNMLALDIALLAGVRRHHFELAMPLDVSTGTRLDGVLAAPVRISLRPWRAFELSIWAIAKLAREREHTNGSAVLWHRDAFGAGAGLGVAARF